MMKILCKGRKTLIEMTKTIKNTFVFYLFAVDLKSANSGENTEWKYESSVKDCRKYYGLDGYFFKLKTVMAFTFKWEKGTWLVGSCWSYCFEKLKMNKKNNLNNFISLKLNEKRLQKTVEANDNKLNESYFNNARANDKRLSDNNTHLFLL